jgi:hypothetical protein
MVNLPNLRRLQDIYFICKFERYSWEYNNESYVQFFDLKVVIKRYL